MNDVGDRLRELLERKAAEVPPHSIVPASVRRRARKRIAVNGIVALFVAVALGGVAVGALRTIERADRQVPGGASTHAKTAAPSGSVAACTAGELRADAELEGAMGSRGGAILLTNYSATTCSLRGRPTLTLLDEQHQAVTGVDVMPTAPAWRVNAEPRPDDWPVVVIAPGRAASVRLRWSNWCRAFTPVWQIGVPGDSAAYVYGMDGVPPPPCNGEGDPSTVEVGPFEPPA